MRDGQELKTFILCLDTHLFTDAIFEYGHNICLVYSILAIPTYYDVFGSRPTHVLKTLITSRSFHKHYGLDAALRKSLKARCFSPTIVHEI